MSMVEKIATAICVAAEGSCGCLRNAISPCCGENLDRARAAIEAMREPSEGDGCGSCRCVCGS
jgi:hypothetical protein